MIAPNGAKILSMTESEWATINAGYRLGWRSIEVTAGVFCGSSYEAARAANESFDSELTGADRALKEKSRRGGRPTERHTATVEGLVEIIAVTMNNIDRLDRVAKLYEMIEVSVMRLCRLSAVSDKPHLIAWITEIVAMSRVVVRSRRRCSAWLADEVLPGVRAVYALAEELGRETPVRKHKGSNVAT